MNNNKTIIITGGAGFIGSALIRYLIKNTDNIIVNIDKLTYAGNTLSLQEVDNCERYFFYKQDICEPKGLKKIFNKHQPNLIMHLAAESHVDRSIDGPNEFLNSNILGTYNLLQASYVYWSNLNSATKSSFKFHHVSTDEVYGDLGISSAAPFTEKSSYNPSSPYSASKASSDHLVRAWHRTFKLPIVITNCSNNYGPYQFPEKLIPLTILNALQGIHIPIYGDGKQVRDWLHVSDHIDALIHVATYGSIGETYNIGGNYELRNIDIVNLICKYLDELKPSKDNSNYAKLIKFVDDRAGHDQRYAIDNSKIKADLSWEPNINFDEGIKETILWYLQNMDWVDETRKNYKGNRLGVKKK